MAILQNINTDVRANSRSPNRNSQQKFSKNAPSRLAGRWLCWVFRNLLPAERHLSVLQRRSWHHELTTSDIVSSAAQRQQEKHKNNNSNVIREIYAFINRLSCGDHSSAALDTVIGIRADKCWHLPTNVAHTARLRRGTALYSRVYAVD